MKTKPLIRLKFSYRRTLPQLTETELKILHFLRGKTVTDTGTLMKELSLSLTDVTEALLVLRSQGFVEFTDRSPWREGEFIIAKLTGKGIQMAQGRISDTTSLPQINVIQFGDNYGAVVQGTQGNVTVMISDAFKPFIERIDEKSDIDEYEKEDLKKKILEIQASLEKKEKTKFESLKTWFGKYAPWLTDIFSSPQVQELVKKALGV